MKMTLDELIRFESIPIDRKGNYKIGHEIGYNKAIDDFSTTLIERLTDAIHSEDVESVRNLINEIAGQLKAGGENE